MNLNQSVVVMTAVNIYCESAQKGETMPIAKSVRLSLKENELSGTFESGQLYEICLEVERITKNKMASVKERCL